MGVTSGKARVIHRLAIAFGIALLPAMLLLAADFGVTWDESYRQAHGERIWLRYQGQSSPTRGSASDHLYGGLFDVTAVALQRVVPRDPYHVRHLLNAAFGWAGIVGCGVLAWRIGGSGMALLAAALLVLSPRYLGHSMNNPKDLPFAVAATWTLVAIAYLPRTFPYLSPRHVIAVGSAIGVSLAIRPGGLLFVAYVALWTLAAMVVRRDWNLRHLCWSALGLAGVLALAMVVPMPVWPFLWEKPFTGVFQAAEQVSHFRWYGAVLFAGQDVRSTALPWTYAPVWLVATTPPVLLAGAVLALATPAIVWLSSRRRRSPGLPPSSAGSGTADLRFLFGLWFAVGFPIVYVILRRSTMYDGLRHLLFIVPALATLAAFGWTMTLARLRGAAKVGACALLALGLAEPLFFEVRNHPNQVVYFQPLVGGPRAAFGRYELDYWGNCLFQALQHAGRIGRAAGRPVVVSGRRLRMLHLNARRIPQVVVARPGDRRHDLELTLLRGRRAALMTFEARPDLLWQVTTQDGAPLCAITPGPQFAELRARLERAGALPSLLPGTASSRGNGGLR